MELIVTNIQRMSTNDGPGIRTVVFLKGCTLRCPWCANPETILPQKQFWFKEEICNAHHGKSPKCEDCEKSLIAGQVYKSYNVDCPFEAIGIYGRGYTPNYLVQELIKDKTYWQCGGGVTFSGGEPLLYAKELNCVMGLLKAQNVNIAMETALHVPIACMEYVINFVDLYLIDLKILDAEKCKNSLNGNVKLFFDNLDYLASMRKDIIFRIPASDEHTLNDCNTEQLLDLLNKFPYPVEIFALHGLGAGKYCSLGLEPPFEYTVSGEVLEGFVQRVRRSGVHIEKKEL